MLRLPSAVRIFLCTEPADMRRGFDGLSAMARDVMRADPLSGHLFVFRNRRGDRVKLLYWDQDGLALWYKRLERGTFHLPVQGEGGAEIDATQLAMMLAGVDFRAIRRRKRYQRKTVTV